MKHSLRNFAALQSGGILKEIPHYLKRDFWYKRSKFENYIASDKWLYIESKRLHQNH